MNNSSAMNANNDVLASAMRVILNERLTIEHHRVENNKPVGLNSAIAIDNDGDDPPDTHLTVDGNGITIHEFLEPDVFYDDKLYGETLLRVIAGYNSARKVLENEDNTTS